MLGFELRSAAQSGHLDAVKAILCVDPTSVNDTDADGWSALHEAAQSGEAEMCFVLVQEARASVDLQNSDLNTPLHLAAEEGHEAVLRYLVEGRAQVNLQNKSRHTPLHRAAANGHEAACRFLVLSAGAQVDALSKNSNTPLMLATGNGHERIVRFLIEEGRAQIDLQNACENTPLHRATMRGYEPIVKMLMEFGANVDVLNKDRLTAAMIQPRGLVAAYKQKQEFEHTLNTERKGFEDFATGLKSELGSTREEVEKVKAALALTQQQLELERQKAELAATQALELERQKAELAATQALELERQKAELAATQALELERQKKLEQQDLLNVVTNVPEAVPVYSSLARRSTSLSYRKLSRESSIQEQKRFNPFDEKVNSEDELPYSPLVVESNQQTEVVGHRSCPSGTLGCKCCVS